MHLKNLPKEISVIIAAQGEPGLHTGYPEDQHLSRGRSSKRNSQTQLGRRAAYAALRHAGMKLPPPISRSKDGSPIWPNGFIGSIAHTAQIAVGVAARAGSIVSVGVDIEPIALPSQLKATKRVALQSEADWIFEAEPEKRFTMLFSTKEALFKCVYPKTKNWFGFKDAELTWNSKFNAFTAKLLSRASPVKENNLWIPCFEHHAKNRILLLAICYWTK